MELDQVLIRNYLPYAKGTIIDRAIPSIDGLKPSHRKILYTMFTMKLLNGGRTKSTNIVGQTMKFHPHGDQSIYGTAVGLSTGNEALNVPYIDSKGNFGKAYSRDMAYAASRYTEAKLAQVCEELFDGINENAVDMVNNYDDTLLEPTLLPVKFPNILVNANNGIAVGTSCSIPSFGINNVCKSVIGILNGTIKDAESLVDVLGIPEFPTGAFINTTRDEMIELIKTGRGSITATSSVVTYPDRIVVNEIPYKATVESIISDTEDCVKSGIIKGIQSINDEIDKNGFKLSFQLKRNANPQEVLNKLFRHTALRCRINFITRVIIDDECRTLGLMELLQEWIKFRMGCINRIYEFKCSKAMEKEHVLSTWEKIGSDIKEVINVITSKNEVDIKNELMKRWGLDEVQADYILDFRIRDITADKVVKRLKELQEARDNIVSYNNVIGSDQEKYKLIIEDQNRIITKYGRANKTHIAAPVVETDEVEEEVIDDNPALVLVTKSGYIKRLITTNDIANYTLPDGEEEAYRFAVKNNEYLLVFTYSGTVYKILVNSIDAGRGKLKDRVREIIGVSDKQIMLIDAAKDYSGHFNIVYANGRGCRVEYSKAQGNRAKYKNLFEESQPGQVWWTFSDKFFMVTKRRKAAYCDLSLMRVFNTRVAFKVARVSNGDSIFGLLRAEDVPDMSKIDLDKYNKEYTVVIGEDNLWAGAADGYRRAKEEKERAKAVAKEAARKEKEAKLAKKSKN